jgi:hypothetical protein
MSKKIKTIQDGIVVLPKDINKLTLSQFYLIAGYMQKVNDLLNPINKNLIKKR